MPLRIHEDHIRPLDGQVFDRLFGGFDRVDRKLASARGSASGMPADSIIDHQRTSAT